MIGTQDRTPYDDVPYLVHAYPQSHPDRLATLALLFGATPPPIECCRVLELGCAMGGNIIPMAEGLPQSEFVGIDLSARQIAAGQDAIATLGLNNITLRHLNILRVDAGFGLYDYIIVHGIYSWVPGAVREQILTICQQNLAPNGIAYVSYNTYPGWHVLSTIRDMMLYRNRGITAPDQRAARAVELLDFLSTLPDTENTLRAPLVAAARFLKQRLEDLGADGYTYLLHDLMEETNDPVYFSQFVEHTARHGLQYLCEAHLPSVFLDHFPAEIRDPIRNMSDTVLDVEQYMDFLRNQTFRQTLLCHDTVPVDWTLKSERVMGLHAASRVKPTADRPDLASVSVERFRSLNNATFATDHPVSKAAMLHLGDVWPQAVPFTALLSAAYERLGLTASPEDEARDAQVLSTNLLRAYSYSPDLVGLHVYAPQPATTIGDRPVARPVARWCAQQSAEIPNLYHEVVKLDPMSHYVLPLLDGSHDRRALLDALMGAVAEGRLAVEYDAAPVSDPAAIEGVLDEELGQVLAFLMASAVLVG